MKTMIPATPERIHPIKVGVMKGINTHQANNAPTGSAKPDNNDNRNARRRLPVA